MKLELELFDLISFLLFTFILYFLSSLSKRLGRVMGIKKYYYIYYLGMFFTLIGSIIMGLSSILFENPILSGYIFFAIGMTLGLIASIKYWGWLIKELIKG